MKVIFLEVLLVRNISPEKEGISRIEGEKHAESGTRPQDGKNSTNTQQNRRWHNVRRTDKWKCFLYRRNQRLRLMFENTFLIAGSDHFSIAQKGNAIVRSFSDCDIEVIAGNWINIAEVLEELQSVHGTLPTLSMFSSRKFV
jgi:hypothetical protein